MAEQAARLCKADLVTEMVGEFPELQGLMGGYYAAKEGLPQEVADAIRDHYKPVGQGDDVPTAPVTVAVSLADKLDTLVGFFAIDEKPTGSKDPFALRRAALGILRLLEAGQIRLPLLLGIAASKPKWREGMFAARLVDGHFVPLSKEERLRFQAQELQRTQVDLLDFFADRLKVQQREAGVRHDLIDAVFALGGEDDLVRLVARVHALQAFVTTEDGVNLLAGYKRAANILKKEGVTVTPAEAGASGEGTQTTEMPAFAGMTGGGEGAQGLSFTPEPAEQALIDALAAAAPRAAEAVEAERFGDAMAALATLRSPIDRFFEEVTVNAEEADKRSARLALLGAFRDAVHRVADFSRIEG